MVSMSNKRKKYSIYDKASDVGQGQIQEFRKGGSKIKFMKWEGMRGGVPPPAPAAFFSFPFIWHENLSTSHNDTVPKY